MDKGMRKQAVYLDLEELKAKDRFSKLMENKTDEELLTLEEQYDSWLNLIDR
jgi:hypothetical protein